MKKFFALILFLFSLSVQGQKIKEYFIDSTDNALDVSGFLNTRAGFMPVPLIITEPAVGFGGGLGAVFFHNKKKRAGETRKGELPPVMTIGAAAVTSNGSKIGLIGHQGSYKQDRFRYTGALGYTDVNLAFYGAGLIDDEEKYDFNIKGFVLFQEFLVRPHKEMPFFLGFNYLFFNNDITFKTGIDDIPEFNNLTDKLDIAGLKFVTIWDTRDNTFTPTKGIFTALELGRFDEAFGGQSNYWTVLNRTYAYLPFEPAKIYSGYRFNWHSKWDNVPFYELPYINLRGIPMLRYQGPHMATVETEWRWQFWRRWSAIGFVGAGVVDDKVYNFDIDQSKVAGGGGFRYLIAKDYGIHAGIDVAKGPEQWAWYLTIGSNWFR